MTPFDLIVYDSAETRPEMPAYLPSSLSPPSAAAVAAPCGALCVPFVIQVKGQQQVFVAVVVKDSEDYNFFSVSMHFISVNARVARAHTHTRVSLSMCVCVSVCVLCIFDSIIILHAKMSSVSNGTCNLIA